MDKIRFITITGVNHYYGMKPFEPGRIIRLVKDKDNEHDEEAICVELPYIDKIGYVANSPNTVAKGTYSAGRVYDLFDDDAYAQVLFITHASVICALIIPEAERKPDKVDVDIEVGLEDNKAEVTTRFSICQDEEGMYVNISER